MKTCTAPKLLTNTETADLLGIRPNTIENWRVKGLGPKFLKIGRCIRYSEADVHAWLEAQTHTSTSQYPNNMNSGNTAV